MRVLRYHNRADDRPERSLGPRLPDPAFQLGIVAERVGLFAAAPRILLSSAKLQRWRETADERYYGKAERYGTIAAFHNWGHVA
jgi:hypothetical protein